MPLRPKRLWFIFLQYKFYNLGFNWSQANTFPKYANVSLLSHGFYVYFPIGQYVAFTIDLVQCSQHSSSLCLCHQGHGFFIRGTKMFVKLLALTIYLNI